MGWASTYGKTEADIAAELEEQKEDNRLWGSGAAAGELQRAQAAKIRKETERYGKPLAVEAYNKGGPVTGKYTKGTGPVNIGDWVAPMKSRGAR